MTLVEADRLQRLIRAEADPRVKQVYAKHAYLEAYRQHTDLRVEDDPHEAVGGMWEEIGRLQAEFLVHKGLQPHHKLLDLGCGTLRGGRQVIPLLDPGNYYGMDISPKAIAYAKQLVQREGLTGKRPRLWVSTNNNLQFRELAKERFDFILAQSVFTHLPPAMIDECFEHVGHIMSECGTFYFTYLPASDISRMGLKDYRYPLSFFERLAARYGLAIRDCSPDYPHPRGLVMVGLTLQSRSPV
jgi:SAM-dependent methyltransferase